MKEVVDDDDDDDDGDDDDDVVVHQPLSLFPNQKQSFF